MPPYSIPNSPMHQLPYFLLRVMEFTFVSSSGHMWLYGFQAQSE